MLILRFLQCRTASSATSGKILPLHTGDSVGTCYIVLLTKAKITRLRRAIRQSLKAQGFSLKGGTVSFHRHRDKRSIRKRHEHAVANRIRLAKPLLGKMEDRLLSFLASGADVDPSQIKPRLHQVKPDTIESMLFKYACLHWSIPISGGYGRRLRFLIFDASNDKLIGLFGLGDPVYSIKARDEWIGWDAKAKAERLYHVMDAYVLGAVPPYSRLLGGKLVALATVCDEVRRAFARRYANRRSLIAGKTHKAHLILVTTTSALGRSSLYNRVKFRERLVFQSVGFTGGWGEFHFSDGVYDRLAAFANTHCTPTAKKEKWGTGFRNRRELVRKALAKLGLSESLLNHGIQREVFVAALAENAKSYLCGAVKRPRYFKIPFVEAVEFWKTRWLLRRAQSDPSFRDFVAQDWRLWAPGKNAGRKSNTNAVH